MASQINKTLDAVLRYAEHGWKLIALHSPKPNGGCSCRKGKDCPSPGKHPKDRDWQEAATDDDETLMALWDKWPDANVGLVMGPRSGVIDVEFDGDEGKATAERIFGECYTPTYKSHRSVHRLFKWSDDLPNIQKVLAAGLEIRLGGGNQSTQSVIPPSKHASGDGYEWLEGLSPDDVDVQPVPDAVLALIWNQQHPADAAVSEKPPSKARILLEAEAIEGDRNNTLYAYACREAQRSPNLDDKQEQADIYARLIDANIARCKPPLDDVEIKDIARKAIAFVQRAKTEANNEQHNFTEHGLRYTDRGWEPGDWKLTIILSDPVMYRLTVPAWAKLTADGTGSIFLTLAQYRDPDRVSAAVQAATHRVILDDQPRVWPAMWNGKPGANGYRGLKAQLMVTADTEDPPSTEKMYVRVCEYLRAKLGNASPCDEPDGTGQPIIKPDGTIWFKWDRVWQDGFMTSQFKREDVVDIRRRLGLCAADYKLYPARGASRARYCVFDPSRLLTLDKLIDGGRDGAE